MNQESMLKMKDGCKSLENWNWNMTSKSTTTKKDFPWGHFGVTNSFVESTRKSFRSFRQVVVPL